MATNHTNKQDFVDDDSAGYTQDESGFKFSEARHLIRDLGRPKPIIYWLDFLPCILIAHVLFMTMRYMHEILPEDPSRAYLVQAILFPVCVILYMRCAMFIHELAHFGDKIPYFRQVWNSLCGVPFLIPSFVYLPHIDHHRRKSYGTDEDGEYFPLAHMSRWYMVAFLLHNLIVPIMAYLRFLVASPICWVYPPARRWVHRHASTMVVDPFYERRDGSPELMRLVVRQEVCCFLWLLWFTFGDWIMTGQLVSPLWLWGYLMGVAVLTLNAVRTLGAHRWAGDGRVLSFEEQLLDTVNYPDRPWVTELWGPIGTRYHALHHLFPTLPYHDAPEAHRRLMAGLPASSPYRETVRTSLLGEIYVLWRRADESATSREPIAT
ncbi:Fatty acid desaturase [Rosistilla carotiformis]|uniref:Fatty acid desaturase n=1 Tax=Rosistilla carotiformis TaxID=2528017 RepID=A0A518JWH4_9BACT|nr:fatty acid desaturase [Rosistilla carotiformis]QDV69885.1 Fatty acid desaturase [Rosistilla carotiformis]